MDFELYLIKLVANSSITQLTAFIAQYKGYYLQFTEEQRERLDDITLTLANFFNDLPVQEKLTLFI